MESLHCFNIGERSSAKVILCLSGVSLPTSDATEQIECGFDEWSDSAGGIAHDVEQIVVSPERVLPMDFGSIRREA